MLSFDKLLGIFFEISSFQKNLLKIYNSEKTMSKKFL